MSGKIKESDKEFVQAAEAGNVDKLRDMLEKALVLVNCTDAGRRTALHYAAWDGHIRALEFLLEKGANIDLVERSGRTPIAMATAGKKKDAVKFLAKNKANLNISDTHQKLTPLHVACKEGSADIVKVLLKYNADPSLKNAKGLTPMEVARENSQDAVIKVFEEFERKRKQKDQENKDHPIESPLPAHIPKPDILPVPKVNSLGSDDKGDWNVEYGEVVFEKKIGEGGYGKVYKGVWAGTKVAIKKLRASTKQEDEYSEFFDEVRIMSKLRHPNILQFLGACVQSPHMFILTEFMDRGSLFDIIHDEKIDLTWPRRISLSKDIARGLLYLHTRKPAIVHRDVKSLNILVDNNWRGVVADFGFTKIKTKSMLSTRVGTPVWAAPEILRNERYTERIDVYSFGIIMWELLTRQTPYHDVNQGAIIGLVAFNKPGIRPTLPPPTPESDAYMRLMIECWDGEPGKRPSIDEVLRRLDAMEAAVNK
eukprot:TRINITY_DN4189_c0_g3_i1.p1 TRINITY_DN4189_c0_g3~~TRINITY_DN4189_c0_g3_i1.p1  ORF type:complete len:481 (-),score=105.34 TRINITY_DN4189_c0_g3_i1:104-1546(-)